MTVSTYACVWCSSSSGAREMHLHERMFGAGTVHRYFECQGCGSLELADVPADMSPYYPAHYMAYSTTDIPDWKHWARRVRSHVVSWVPLSVGRRLRAPWILQALHGRMPSRDTSILDVGCGTGAALCHLADAGYTNLNGLEPFIPADRRLSNGVFIRSGTLKEMDGHFALIMCHHSLEHMADPVEALTHLRRLLLPGGNIWVRVPLTGGVAWQQYGTDWVQLDPPRHLSIPSLAGMTAATQRVKLRIERIEFDSSAFQFWGSELTRRKIPLVDAATRRNVDITKHFTMAELTKWEAQARELNLQGLGDQVGFWIAR